MGGIMRGILRRPEPLVLPSARADRAALVDSYRKRIYGMSVAAAIVATIPNWVTIPYFGGTPFGGRRGIEIQSLSSFVYFLL